MLESTSNRAVLFVGGAGKREAPFWNAVAGACAEKNLRFFSVFQGFFEEERCEIAFPHLFTGHFDGLFAEFLSMASVPAPQDVVALLGPMVVAQVRPRAAIVWNGLDRTQRAWRRFLEDAGVVTLITERAAFPALFVLERKGINGLSELLWDAARLERMRAPLDADESARVHRALELVRASKAVTYRKPDEAPVADLRQRLGLSADDRIVLFLGNWDEQSGVADAEPEVQKAQSPLFDSSRAAANALAEAVRSVPRGQLIVRPHPFDRADWPALAAAASAHLVPNAEVTDLIEQADVVAGLTTNLLYHAAAYDKPVLLMGRTAFYGHGFSYDLRDAASLQAVLQEALSRADWAERQTNRDRFFAEYLFRFCYSVDPEFQRLGVRGPAAFVESIAQQMTDAAPEPHNAEQSLAALSTAVQAANYRILEQGSYIEYLKGCIKTLEQQPLREFLPGWSVRTIKRIPGVSSMIARLRGATAGSGR